MSTLAFAAQKFRALPASVCGNIGRTGGTAHSRGCSFDLDEIHKVTASVVTWASFVDVTHVVGDFAGWTLKIVVLFRLVQAFEAERMETREQTSMFSILVILVVTDVTQQKLSR